MLPAFVRSNLLSVKLIYPREMKICIPIKQPKRDSMDVHLMNKYVVYLYSVVYLFTLQKSGILIHATNTNLENIVLSERS